MQKIYICVSHDEYELPEAIADTAQELADICGTTKAVVQSCISKYEHGKTKWTRYRKVVIK